ncbi:peptidoglycan/LPS O-acetylase OafA/YrhL [Thermomonospora umbrina]|uniref:Peptidoglycan/LPS O-acetylase OafA/YrhL n=1 Tax=Thermomonospora umbrina TaxID=111806 RepID=A0A3D9SMN1_9ACTN|nr:peptidoglycan/LPS O-acetylase OafA/YrhL [Thermomonospora umbrina]
MAGSSAGGSRLGVAEAPTAPEAPTASEGPGASEGPRRDRPGGARLAWLDALRGIGALLVVFEHLAHVYLPEVRTAISGWFVPGTWGVFVFFLVSGYIVPASLERTRSVRGFWISRLFRLYPLWAAVVALALGLALAGLQPHTRSMLDGADPAATAFAHLAMLQTLLASPSAVYVMWSLAFEMAFYLLVVALFALRSHHRSAPIAVGLAVAAVAFGGVLPSNGLSRAGGTTLVAVLGTVLAIVAIAGAMSGRRRIALAGALLGGLLAVLLFGFNGTSKPWEGITMLAVMFLGTVVYRVEHGQIRRRTAVVAVVAVLGCAMLTGVLHVADTVDTAARLPYQREWAVTVLLAALTFAAGVALRHRRLPKALTLLGVLSYSLYLLHPVLLEAHVAMFDGSRRNDWVMAVGFLCVLVPVCWLTQRYIEAPAQRLGRRVRNAVDRPR